MAVDVKIPVFPTKYVSAWGGPGSPTGEDVAFAPLRSVVEALEMAYPDDAHGVGYAFVDDDVCPRVSVDALRAPEVVDALRMVVGFIDLDRPGHAPWDSRGAVERAVAVLTALFPRLAVFATKAGVRLVYVLPTPLRIPEYRRLVVALQRQVEGILSGSGLALELDTTTFQWSRMFRMPNVLRDGQRTSEAPYYLSVIPADFGPLPACPENLLGATKIPATSVHEHAVDLEAPLADRPTDVVLTDEDWSELFAACADGMHVRGWSGLLLDLRHGRPFYGPGERNSRTFRAIATLLSVAAEARVPMPPDSVYAIFEASTKVTTGSTPPEVALDELWGMAVRLCKATEYAEDPAHLTLPQKMARTRYGDLPRIVYTSGKSKYMWDGNEFTEAFSADDAFRAYFRTLYENIFTGVKKLPVADLLTYYGVKVKGVILDMGAEAPRLEDGHLIVPMDRRSNVPATYHADCAEWLTHIAGDDLEGVLDWLCWYPKLQHNVCALFLCGAPAAGKSMLGQALSQFWGGEFCSFDHAMGNFTGQLRKSPLIWLDEGTRAKDASAAFRRFVANDRHQLEQKHRDPETVRGCYRVLVTANREGALPLDDVQSVEDVHAILERVRFVHVSDAASRWLQGKGGREFTSDWVTRPDGTPGKLAEHIAWLIENREVTTHKHGDRFKVQGRPTAWHYRALYSGAVGGVLSVIAEQVALNNVRGLAYFNIDRQEILVNPVGLLANNKVRDALRADNIDVIDARNILRSVCLDDAVELDGTFWLVLPTRLIRDMPRHVFRTEAASAAVATLFSTTAR